MSKSKKSIFIEITEEESETVERLFYEHNAGKDNIAFLMKEKDINYDILQEYINIVEARYVELELLKGEMGEKYRPDDNMYNFTFDFKRHGIVFEEV